MPGGWGILEQRGPRQKVTNHRIEDIENYVHKLAKNSLQMDDDGNVDIIGVINIGTAGGIFQGTGTFASPTTGLKIYNSGGAGRIELWDASAESFRLRHTQLLFGSDVSAAATTALAVFAEDQTYNSESLGAGDVLLGDNSANKANLLWDKSAGKLQLRGGTTMQCEIGTDGVFNADGGNIKLSSTGLWLAAVSDYTGKRISLGGTSASPIAWLSCDGLATFFRRYVAQTNAANKILDILSQDATSGPYYASSYIAYDNRTANLTSGFYVTAYDGAADRTLLAAEGYNANGSTFDGGVSIYYGLNVGTATGAGTGDIHLNDTVRVGTAAKNISIFATGAGEDISSTNTLHLNYSNNQTVAIGAGGTSALTVSGDITLAAGSDLILATSTGTRIGTATTQLLSFWNATPATQPTGIADADGTLADATTKLNSLLAKLETIGILAVA